MAKMYLMSGASGAGKTTFAKQFISNLEMIAQKEIQYLCIDDFYRVFNGSEKRHEDEFDVWIAFFQAIHLAELKGRNVLIDTNSPTLTKRIEFLDWFPSFEHHLIFIDANAELCIKNNKSRNRVIPMEEMQNILASVERPTPNEDARWKTISMYRNNDNKHYEMIWRTGSIWNRMKY